MANFKPAKIERTNAEPLGDILKLFVVSNRLGYGLFNQEVCRAWDQASGLAMYSSNKFYRDGVFHVTLKSSLVRSRISFRREEIAQAMNEYLEQSNTVKLSGIEEKITKIVLH